MKLMEAKGSRRSAAVKCVRRPRRASVVAALAALALSVVTVAYASSLVLTPSYDWYTKDPSASSYEVATAPEMLGLAYLTNGLADLDGDGATEPAVDFSGKTINQTADITFRSASGYIPAGTPEHPFNGTFNGQGHQITNLTIDCGSESTPAAKAADGATTPATTTTCYVGLFGYCGADSTLENVTVGNTVAIRVVDPVTSATGATGALDEAVTADTVIHDVGSLVGYTEGSVSGVTSYATVTATNNLAATDNDPEVVLNVGGIAGTIEGSLTSCAGAGNIAVTAPTLAPDTQDCVVANVGGLVGTLGAATADGRSSHAGAITNCTYGYSDDSGYFGIGTTQVTLHVVTTGVGGLDRFGVEKEATSISVGGIAGYSYGSIANCTNYALINTNSADARLYKNSQGLVRIVKSDELTPDTYPTAEDLFAIANGGSGVGGVVGTMRAGGMSAEGVERTDVGSAEDAITLTQSFNMGTVVGLAHTGGIAGSVGSYAAIDSCRNGKVSAKGTGTTDDCGHVVTTRWNKPMTGGIVGATYSNVSNCCNLSEVENIQTGYYTAGIVGSLRSPDDYTAECYACFNSGQVHVSSYATQSYREAGLVGNNAGYLHDSVMRSGCVLAHDDGDATYPNAAIGDDSWGMWSNVTFASVTDLKKSETAAVLNAAHAQDVLTLPEQDWTYWYIAGVGYPVLNVWDEPTDRADLTSANVSATCVTLAEYAGTSEAIPDLIVTYTAADGTQSVLVQNVDYYVIPQKGACAMTSLDADTTPYQASIIGIGNYQGTVENICRYGIGPCDLSNCDVSVSPQSYNFGACVYPDAVYVTNPAGVHLDASEFRYEIFDIYTFKVDASDAKSGVVFDSAGYVSWDGGATRQTVASQHDRLCSDLTGIDYILYNADGEAIFKVEGGAPGQTNGAQYEIDPYTGHATERDGLNIYKSASEGITGGGLAGYVVKVTPLPGATSIKQSSWTTGQYVISSLDLYKDCTVEKVELDVPNADGTATTTQTWYWNSEKSTLYTLDAQGNPVLDEDGSLLRASVDFTGDQLDPRVTISYTKENGQKVLIPQDTALGYTLIYGDPYTKKVDLDYTNRDATPVSDPGDDATEAEKALYDQLKGHEKAAVTARATTTYRFSNYVHMYFTINPVDVSECAITMPGTPDDSGLCTYAYRSGYGVRPTVSVTRCGNTLIAGTDYTVTYDNNVEPTTQDAIDAYLATGDTSGLASCTVTGLGNVTGSQTYYFMIASGKSLSEEGITIQPIEDQPYNWGYSVQVPGGLTLLDKDGEPATLVEGEDYQVTYLDNEDLGTAQVTVKGINVYTGVLKISFEIVRLNLDDPRYANRVSDYQFLKGCSLGAVPYGTGTVDGSSNLGFTMYGYPITDWSVSDPQPNMSEEVRQTCFFNWTAVEKTTGATYTYNWFAEGGNSDVMPGDYSVTLDLFGDAFVTGWGGLRVPAAEGTRTIDVTVVKRELNDCTYTNIDSYVYDGQSHEPILTGYAQRPDSYIDIENDCIVTYEDNIEAGTAKCIISAKDSCATFCGSAVVTFQIRKYDLADATVVVADQKYTGEALTPQVKVYAGDMQLLEGRDFTVTYADNVKKGIATAVVTGIGSCEGEKKAVFTIGSALNIASAEVSAVPDQLYTGEAIAPKPVVTYDGQELVEGTDYALSYQNNADVSTEKLLPTITITGKGSYAGSSKTVTFNIVSVRDLSEATVADIPDQAYTGEEVTPSVTVTYGDDVLTEGVDYTLVYRRNVQAGSPAFVRITGMGSYQGTVDKRFDIVVRDGVVSVLCEGATSGAAGAAALANVSPCSASRGAVVVGKSDYAMQAVATVLAQAKGYPVLLASHDTLDSSTLQYLLDRPMQEILMVGDVGSLSDTLQATLTSLVGSEGTVTRLDGATDSAISDSVQDALKSLAVGSSNDNLATVVVANSDAGASILPIVAWAARYQVPIILTAADGTLDDAELTSLSSCKSVYILGDWMSVDASVDAALTGSVSVARIGTDDVYSLSATVCSLEREAGTPLDAPVILTSTQLRKYPTVASYCAAAGVQLIVADSNQQNALEVLAGGKCRTYGVSVVGSLDEQLVSAIKEGLSW